MTLDRVQLETYLCDLASKKFRDGIIDDILKDQDAAKIMNEFTNIFSCGRCDYVRMEKGKSTHPIKVICPNCGERK